MLTEKLDPHITIIQILKNAIFFCNLILSLQNDLQVLFLIITDLVVLMILTWCYKFFWRNLAGSWPSPQVA